MGVHQKALYYVSESSSQWPLPALYLVVMSLRLNLLILCLFPKYLFNHSLKTNYCQLSILQQCFSWFLSNAQLMHRSDVIPRYSRQSFICCRSWLATPSLLPITSQRFLSVFSPSHSRKTAHVCTAWLGQQSSILSLQIKLLGKLLMYPSTN